MNYLGIDYGRRKIGLSISEGLLARPLAVWPNSPKLIKKLADLSREQQISRIVVGLPEGELKAEIETWGKKLESVTSLKVIFQAEYLSTKEAKIKMITAGKSQKFRREKEDMIAATLILQDYLESN